MPEPNKEDAKRAELRLTIPALSPGTNELIRMHRAVYAKEKAKWSGLFREALAAGGFRTDQYPRFQRAFITIERYGFNYLDWDNLAGCAKIPQDAMRELLLFPQDDPRYIKGAVVQPALERDRRKYRTIIIITGHLQ